MLERLGIVFAKMLDSVSLQISERKQSLILSSCCSLGVTVCLL